MDIKAIFKFVSITFLTFFLSSLLTAVPPSLPPLKTVAITQIMDHPSANSVYEGILAALKAEGYEDGKNLKLIYENAQGSPITATQIAQNFVALKPDVIVPITTTSTQAVVKADTAYGIPVVFAAVTDPLVAGIVTSLTHPGGYITGSTDAAPLKRQFDVFMEILPQMKSIGIIYNPGDNSSATPLKEAREITKELGITLEEAVAFKTADVPGAIQQLVGKNVEGIFVPLDNTILSAMNAVLNIAFQHKIPVFSSDSDSVAQGALASSGYTHFDTGYTAGKMVVQVLQGANAGDIPVANPQDLNIYINPQSAEKLKITFPDSLLKSAKKL